MDKMSRLISKMNNPQAVDKLWKTKIVVNIFCEHVDNFINLLTGIFRIPVENLWICE